MMKAILPFIALLLVACGGSQRTLHHGTLLNDGYLVGLPYVCGTLQGRTNAQGFFVFEAGKSCAFYVGATLIEVPVEALTDRIVTPFELTGSLQAGLSLSRLLQSISTPNAQNLPALDASRLQRLPNFSPSDPGTIDSAISSLGGTPKPMGEVQKALEVHYDLTTGQLLTEAQKKAKADTKTSTDGTDTGGGTDKPSTQTCPTGSKCKDTGTTDTTDKNPGKDTNTTDHGNQGDKTVCLPGQTCVPQKAKEAQKPCFPGDASCDNLTPNTCLPGTDCTTTPTVTCTPGTDCTSDTNSAQCLPGQNCTTNTSTKPPTIPSGSGTSSGSGDGTSDFCLPGRPCGSARAIASFDAPMDNASAKVCLPGAMDCY